jgi:hypothetical protein
MMRPPPRAFMPGRATDRMEGRAQADRDDRACARSEILDRRHMLDAGVVDETSTAPNSASRPYRLDLGGPAHVRAVVAGAAGGVPRHLGLGRFDVAEAMSMTFAPC